MNVFSHPEFDNHEHLSFFCDPETGLKAIVAIHNTSRGPALGGCRMFAYVNDEEAVRDVLRLSRGMTYKSALANLDLGGGKSVIIGDPRTQKSEALLEAMGKHLESLGGQYIAAEDSGTSVPDLKVMGRHTKYVAGIIERTGFDGRLSNGDPSPTTAYGTFIGLKAAVQHKLGREDLTGLKVAIQGVGNVGYRLAHYLKQAGAELWVYDIHHENMQRAVAELGAHAASAEDILFLPVDVIAPCAMGAVINDDTIPHLNATVIAGAANNLLQRPDHDQALKDRGILYAPDFAINAGGIIDVFYEGSNASPDDVRAHVENIGQTLAEIFTRSDSSGIPTGAIANALAEERFRSFNQNRYLAGENHV
ncbi:MAG TPA: Glu/Leu/Phe/Val dehydrogenase [Marinobacter sp.]|uniref:Glu/Leu/Phe/Val dehydrogenase n=2 Tax=root TaxID=1 RepID=A0A831R1E8_9GAMM|nr:Glu/Leu/Phe/Val dehydrogenase dimerization domain-containing protein [Marinobacter antarcticus]HDZ37614.1 Glu/Leu/Phe/Val dehydrogenase [Marinobacter sp.]HEA50832.1 Glu/Leu/Phe/Val dehydrogenase [Marinobacter antarcticus]